MGITLKNLIQIAPFPPEQKKVFLENIDKLSEDEKYELSKAAWKGLAFVYYGQLQTEKNAVMEEVILNKREYNQNDFTEIEARLLHDMSQKLETVSSQDSIEEVKKQLELYKVKPLDQDPSHSPT